MVCRGRTPANYAFRPCVLIPGCERSATMAPPTFFFGFQRSGTTLFSAMLDCHPDLAVPFSLTGLWFRYGDRLGDYNHLKSDSDLGRLVDALLSEERFAFWHVPLPRESVLDGLPPGNYPAVIERFHRLYASHHAKSRWGHLDITSLVEAPTLLQWFPDAKFVHIVRDARDVALSNQGIPFSAGNILECAEKWRNEVGANLAWGAGLSDEQYLVIRFEDLVTESEATLKRLCAFLDLTFEPSMLAYPTRVEHRVPDGRREALWHLLDRPPQASQAGRWRRDMSPAQKTLVEDVAGTVLEAAGYEKDRAPRATIKAVLLKAALTVDRGGRGARASSRLNSVRGKAGSVLRRFTLPKAAKAAVRRDRDADPGDDPGIDKVVELLSAWLATAQECSRSSDGGFARHYSLIDGWATSYPETTGYIIPTLLRLGGQGNEARARKALDWLVSIQMDNGAFQGGPIGVEPVPVAFNTGQVLLGLAAGQRAFGGLRDAVEKAADFLVEAQDADGCWRRYSSPFVTPGEKAYDTHAALGLIEAHRLLPDRGYGTAALRNAAWALTKVTRSGWIRDCCLDEPDAPLTHTLGYAIKGLLEAYRFSREDRFLTAAEQSARGLLFTQRNDGALPGQVHSDWSAAVPWSCLTGNAQIAECWLLLFEETGDAIFLEAGRRANAFTRRCVKGPTGSGATGGLAGSFPIDGEYAPFQYLSWAAKFAIDTNILEQKLTGGRDGHAE